MDDSLEKLENDFFLCFFSIIIFKKILGEQAVEYEFIIDPEKYM